MSVELIGAVCDELVAGCAELDAGCAELVAVCGELDVSGNLQSALHLSEAILLALNSISSK
jgi:hypothetical protein